MPLCFTLVLLNSNSTFYLYVRIESSQSFNPVAETALTDSFIQKIFHHRFVVYLTDTDTFFGKFHSPMSMQDLGEIRQLGIVREAAHDCPNLNRIIYFYHRRSRMTILKNKPDKHENARYFLQQALETKAYTPPVSAYKYERISKCRI